MTGLAVRRELTADAWAQLARGMMAAFPYASPAEDTVEVYFEALRDLPADHVSRAVGDAIKESPRFPTIAEIRERVVGPPAEKEHRKRVSSLPDYAGVGRTALSPVEFLEFKRQHGVGHGETCPTGVLALAPQEDIYAGSEVGRVSSSGRWVARWQTRDVQHGQVWGEPAGDDEDPF